MNEKYIPLYRKYRPQILEEVVGQEHVKKALTNAINLNKISHAYLFTGPRGTGKTSTARILAKSLNCIDGPTVKPCGKCPSCIDITNSTPIDVVEIDAASNRSVNDAQNILEKIQYAPVNGKYKIYIIDEVHMLTVTAFNALLKTLEEPPKNVVFILATTEVHKVLDTIKSRCQRFDFKRITTEDIVKHLKHISELEKIDIDDDAILTIAKNAQGGMRDSLALLDQLSVLDTQKTITTEDINSLLGRLSFDILNKLSNSIIESNANNAIEILEEIYNNGNEPTQILTNLLNYFKNLLIVKNCKSELIQDLTQTTSSQTKTLNEQVEKLETQQIVFLIDRTTHYINALRFATNQHLWLEIAMIDLSNMTENSKIEDLQNRLIALERGESTNVTVSNYKTPPQPVQKPSMKPANLQQAKPIDQVSTQVEPQKTIVETKKEEEFSPIPVSSVDTKTKSAEILTLWYELLSNITSVPTKSLLQQLAKPVEITPKSTVITLKQEIYVRQWNESNKKLVVIDAVNKLFSQKNSNVIIRLPLPTDMQVSTTAEPKQQTPQIAEKITKKQNEIKPQNSETTVENKTIMKPIENTEMSEVIDVVPTEKSATNTTTVISDQVKMVKDLFEGKIVE